MDNNNDNEKILSESNHITSVSQAPAITIVNATPDMEAISVNQDGEVDPISIEYNEYREKLKTIYETTTDENCMISEFVVDGNKCNHTLTIRQLNGERNIVLNREFEYNESFKKIFLPAMIEDYNKYNFVFDSNIGVLDSTQINFSVRTKENDILSIKNIDANLAKELNDLFYEKNISNESFKNSKNLLYKINNRGNGNTLVIVLTIILIGITLAGVIFFTVMTKK